MDHEAFRVRNPQKYLPGNVQTSKNFWDSIKWSLPIPPTCQVGFFKQENEWYLYSHIQLVTYFHMELFCVSSPVPNQLSFVSVTQHTWASTKLEGNHWIKTWVTLFVNIPSMKHIDLYFGDRFLKTRENHNSGIYICSLKIPTSFCRSCCYYVSC